jgi:predicted DNA-binding transcriptional regulator AlpA
MSGRTFKCERLWTIDTVVEKLGVSRMWVYHQSRKAGFPRFKVGGKLKFDPAEIDEWLEGRRLPLPQPKKLRLKKSRAAKNIEGAYRKVD